VPVLDDDDDHARRSLRRCGDDGEGMAPNPPDAPGVPRSADAAMADNAAMVAVAVDNVTRHMMHIERRRRQRAFPPHLLVLLLNEYLTQNIGNRTVQ
jgi:hypothetical protein